MPLFKGVSDWRAYRKARRATNRELRDDRKSRGVKRGDPIYDAANTAAADELIRVSRAPIDQTLSSRLEAIQETARNVLWYQVFGT